MVIEPKMDSGIVIFDNFYLSDLGFLWWGTSKELFSGRIEAETEVWMRVDVEFFSEECFLDNISFWGCLNSRCRLNLLQ